MNFRSHLEIYQDNIQLKRPWDGKYANDFDL